MDDMQAFLEDEEIRINREIADMIEIERQTESTQPKSSSTLVHKTLNMFEDMDIDDDVFANIQVPEVDNENKKSIESKVKNATNIRTNLDKKKVEKNAINLSSSMEDDVDFFENIDLDNHLDQLEKKMAYNLKQSRCSQPDKSKINISVSDTSWNKIDSDDRNTIQIEQTLDIWRIEKLTKYLGVNNNGQFKIKGKFKTIIEKLTLTEQEFHLVVEVEDGTGCITVKVHNDIVAGWAEYTAEQLNDLKSNIQQNIAETQAKVVEVNVFNTI